MNFESNGLHIELMQGDISQLDVDAITNAANSRLILGAGVAGAIASAGGPSIQRECDAIGQCAVGSAVITRGGNLQARHVIHAVGPRMGEGDESNKLASAIRATLNIAENNQLASVALPAISTGIFSFPIDQCGSIMAREIQQFAADEPHYLKKVVVCLYDRASYETFVRQFTAHWQA